DEIASVIRSESRDFERVERAGEIGREAEQMLEPLRLEHEIAKAARLQVLLDVAGERRKKRDELRVIFRRDVRLEPDLQHAERLLLEHQRHVQKGIRRF